MVRAAARPAPARALAQLASFLPQQQQLDRPAQTASHAQQAHMQLLAQQRAQTALVGRRTWTQTRRPRVTIAVQARTQSLGLQLATTA